MKLSSNYTLFAELVIRDETKKVSLINLFDRLYAPSIPTIQSKFNIIFGLIVEGKALHKEDLFLYAYGPDKKIFLEAKIAIPIDPPENNETQIVADLSGMSIPKYGDYRFALAYSKDKEISSRTLKVIDPAGEGKISNG